MRWGVGKRFVTQIGCFQIQSKILSFEIRHFIDFKFQTFYFQVSQHTHIQKTRRDNCECIYKQPNITFMGDKCVGICKTIHICFQVKSILFHSIVR